MKVINEFAPAQRKWLMRLLARLGGAFEFSSPVCGRMLPEPPIFIYYENPDIVSVYPVFFNFKSAKQC